MGSLEKSMKFAFKANLGKNSSAFSPLYVNKQNTYSWTGTPYVSHIACNCLSKQLGQAQDLTKCNSEHQLDGYYVHPKLVQPSLFTRL